MSSSDRRQFLRSGLALLAAVPVAGGLAGCTFTPAYAPGGPANKLLNRTLADAPSDKNGFDLVERLEERLGRASVPDYLLSYVITTKATGVGITPVGAITRYDLTGSVDWTLSAADGGARLAGGKVQSFTSYAATGSTVAGLAAEEAAAFRLMRLLADQIVTRLIAESARFA